MSIINDALKKTQAKLEENTRKAVKVEPPAPQPAKPKVEDHQEEVAIAIPSPSLNPLATPKRTQPVPPPPRSRDARQVTSKAPVAKVSILLAICSIVILFAFIVFINRPPLTQSSSEPIPAATKPTPAVTNPPLVKETPVYVPPMANQGQPLTPAERSGSGASDELVLTGISYIENKYVAIINGDIYEAGEAVNGKEIISIDIKKVDIRDDNGSIITLRVKK